MKARFWLVIGLLPLWANAEISTPITTTLDNGFGYTILPLHADKNRLELRLQVKAGGVDEWDGQHGVAHMTEHLVFRASDQHPQGVMTHLHDTGWVRAKHYNAVTTADTTTYMMTPPTQVGLDGALSALSQMMFFAHLSQDDLDKERQIVLEEWRGKQGVASRMDEQRKSVVRAGSRYVRSTVIGSEHDIRTMPAEYVQRFYHTWYVPNNMHLLIVGDVNAQDVHAKVQAYFGQIPQKALPKRDYYEPTLTHQLAIKQLQDDRSGVNQVGYIVRFDEPHKHQDSQDARRQRLIDRLTLTFMTKRLQNESHFAAGVKNVVVRKSDIGKTTSAIGLFASVDKDSHHAGLQEIFHHAQKLKTYPITPDELNALKADYQQLLDKAHQHQDDRDFNGWVQALVITELAGKPYQPQRQIAKLNQDLIQGITTDDIHHTLLDWLDGTDRIVQYQAPHQHQPTPITQDDVHRYQTLAQNSTIAPPTKPTPPTLITPDKPDTQAVITAIKWHKAHNVYEFTLSNGHRVLWLKSNLAKDKSHLQAVSQAGFMNQPLNPWQSQIATQLVSQNTPKTYSQAQMEHYKKSHQLFLSFKHSERYLSIDGTAPNDKLDKWLSLYHHSLHHTPITHGFDDAVNGLRTALHGNANLSNVQNQRTQSLSTLRQNAQILPSDDELNTLGVDDLHRQWQHIQNAPITLYVINDLSLEQMTTLITDHLGTPHTTTALSYQHAPKSDTVKTVHFASLKEPKHDVQLWSSTPHAWHAQDAMTVAILKQLANQQLKQVMRDEQLGVYRVEFDATLNPNTHQIQSHLKFTTSPDKSAQLIDSAKSVLANLPYTITPQQVQTAKEQFIKQEKARLSQPQIWLDRLILSDRHYHSPYYLGQMQNMAQNISFEQAKHLASKLYRADDVQIFVDIPNHHKSAQ